VLNEKIGDVDDPLREHLNLKEHHLKEQSNQPN
jgi:hypothetical protein